jgi:hypothetical protein
MVCVTRMHLQLRYAFAMPERWERIYAKFFWALVILSTGGWVAAGIYSSLRSGTLRVDAIEMLKYLGPIVLAQVLLALILQFSKPFSVWARKGRMHSFVAIFSCWMLGYVLPTSFANSKEPLFDRIGMGLVFSGISAFVFKTNDNPEKLDAPARDSN